MWIKHEDKAEETQTFLGLILRVKGDEEQKKCNDFDLDKLLSQDFCQCLKELLKEYYDVFPQDLPPRLP